MNAALSEAEFFDYHCALCDAYFCERVHLMNLALENLEDEYCLVCLAKEQEMSLKDVSAFVYGYVESRECFKTPWDKFEASKCPYLDPASHPPHGCYCQPPLLPDIFNEEVSG
jgi:hypothetical protein